eukprot:scaffold6749_cov113-Cylindrotheca_fusiformis.AAC.2
MISSLQMMAAVMLVLVSLTAICIPAGAFVRHPYPHQRHYRVNRSGQNPLFILWDPKNNDDQINSELVDFPTPSQKKELKKETNKRLARKKLPFFPMPEDECFGSFSDASLKEIWTMLQEHEIVQIRGIARDEKKLVFQLATRLCLELEYEQERKINDSAVLPVALISVKGHSAIIYSPTLDLDHPNKFPLRTSVGQKNTWTERIKAPRDHRGQIVKD